MIQKNLLQGKFHVNAKAIDKIYWKEFIHGESSAKGSTFLLIGPWPTSGHEGPEASEVKQRICT